MRTWTLLPVTSMGVCLVFSFFLAACSGGAAGVDDAEIRANPGVPPSQQTPGTVPTTPIGPAVTFDPTFVDLGKAGAFPSDLATDDEGSLYTMDDAAIPAVMVRFGATGARTTMPITAADLVDDDGTQPATAASAFDFAGGLFGAYTGDVEVARAAVDTAAPREPDGVELEGSQRGRVACTRGHVLLAEGDRASARSAHDEAAAVAKQLGAGPDSPLGRDVTELDARLSS